MKTRILFSLLLAAAPAFAKGPYIRCRSSDQIQQSSAAEIEMSWEYANGQFDMNKPILWENGWGIENGVQVPQYTAFTSATQKRLEFPLGTYAGATDEDTGVLTVTGAAKTGSTGTYVAKAAYFRFHDSKLESFDMDCDAWKMD